MYHLGTDPVLIKKRPGPVGSRSSGSEASLRLAFVRQCDRTNPLFWSEYR